MVVYRGLCAISDIKELWPVHTYATIWMAPGKHFLTFPISDNRTLNVVGFVSTSLDKMDHAEESWTLAGRKSEVQEAFKDFDPAVLSVINMMEANPLKWILYDRESLDQWSFSNGKVALLGDAAHAMCPHQGKFISHTFGLVIHSHEYTLTLSPAGRRSWSWSGYGRWLYPRENHSQLS